MKQLADEGEYDIEDALKMAGAAVAGLRIGFCRRECPTYESTLTRRLVLGRVPNNCLGTASGDVPTQYSSSPFADPLLHRGIELS